MKNAITRFTILLALVLIPITSDAKLPFIVQTIYFQPTNAPAPTDRIAELMIKVQDLYRAEMERNGYDAKTFRLEKDNAGKVVVHTIEGQHNIAHYQATTSASILRELPAKFKNKNNIQVVIVAGLRGVNNTQCGVGWPTVGGSNGGSAFIAMACGSFGVRLIAHELGHAFGLYHNIIGTPSIMGGGNKNELNDYESRWLDKHHYFNNVHRINNIPKVVNVLPFKAIELKTVLFRFNIENIDELHQAQAFRASDTSIVAWCELENNKDTAEFLISRSIIRKEQQLWLQIMDTQGDTNLINVDIANLPEAEKPVSKKAIEDGDLNEGITDGRRPTPSKNRLIKLWARIKMRR